MQFKNRLTSVALVGFLALAPVEIPVAAAEVREPQVAGQFYPGNAAELRAAVRKYLVAAPKLIDRKPIALLSPHAGYPYSGPVAAAAFKQVEGLDYDNVIVVAFNHRIPFPGGSIDTAETYRTPLGEIPVNLELAQRLHDAAPGWFARRPQVHASGEHSLEVMLPFLQTVLPGARLVPVMMGGHGLEDARILSKALAPLIEDGNTLVVFSTDLSHYYPSEEARRLDGKLIAALSIETPMAMSRLLSAGAVEACGRGPLTAFMALGDRMGYAERTLLRYAHSGDIMGDNRKVVGYAAAALLPREQLSREGALDAAEGQAMVRYARWALENHFGRDAGPKPDVSAAGLARERGFFVTLNKEGQLRGCIGRIQNPDALRSALPVVALQAALEDPRFPPLQAEELDAVRIEVSVLTPPQKVASHDAVVAGRDGVVIRHKGRSGVFLPSVWHSTGWTKENFLSELAFQKAHLPADAWKYAELYTFQAEEFHEEGF